MHPEPSPAPLAATEAEATEQEPPAAPAEQQEAAPALSAAQNAPTPVQNPDLPQPPELTDNAPNPDLPQQETAPTETSTQDDVDPSIIRPTPEQMAAAIAMLRGQAVEPEHTDKPTRDKKMADSKPRRGQEASRQPIRRQPANVRVRPMPAVEAPQDDVAPMPTVNPAEQRGLRSPTLPKLLPMDLDGKIHS